MNGSTLNKPTIMELPMGPTVFPIYPKVNRLCSAEQVYLESKQCGCNKIWMWNPDSMAGPLECNVFAS